MENLDLDIGIKAVVSVGGVDIWITDTLISTWIIMGVLIALAIVVRVKSRKFKEVPKGFQNVIEYLVEMFDNFVRGAAGEKLMFLGNWFLMVFAFILLSNISGLFLLRPPTADWATTFAVAVVTFVLIHVMGGKFRKLKYVKSLLEPSPVFLPINLIGEIARPISLSFRLFGNILAGSILMTLLYSLAPIFVKWGIPAALHIYFDIFAGVMQTYIFTILSLSFISGAAIGESE